MQGADLHTIAPATRAGLGGRARGAEPCWASHCRGNVPSADLRASERASDACSTRSSSPSRCGGNGACCSAWTITRSRTWDWREATPMPRPSAHAGTFPRSRPRPTSRTARDSVYRGNSLPSGLTRGWKPVSDPRICAKPRELSPRPLDDESVLQSRRHVLVLALELHAGGERHGFHQRGKILLQVFLRVGLERGRSEVGL